MNVSKISMAQPAFKAKVTITAPEELLSKEDREYFESLGPKIGKDSDTLDITISKEMPSKIKPNATVYNYSYRYDDKNHLATAHRPIPYRKGRVIIEENSPKNYLDKIFAGLLNKR